MSPPPPSSSPPSHNQPNPIQPNPLPKPRPTTFHGGMSAASDGIPNLLPMSDASSSILFELSSSHAREWWCALRMRTILRALPSPLEFPPLPPPPKVDEDEDEFTWSTSDLSVSTMLASCISTVCVIQEGEGRERTATGQLDSDTCQTKHCGRPGGRRNQEGFKTSTESPTCAIWKACSRSTSPSSGDCPRWSCINFSA